MVMSCRVFHSMSEIFRERKEWALQLEITCFCSENVGEQIAILTSVLEGGELKGL